MFCFAPKTVDAKDINHTICLFVDSTKYFWSQGAFKWQKKKVRVRRLSWKSTKIKETSAEVSQTNTKLVHFQKIPDTQEVPEVQEVPENIFDKMGIKM